jgi:Glycogen recognition site of AMP-activated protein kinase
MAKTTKTPKTNSKSNGTVSEPPKPVTAQVEPAKALAPKSEPIKPTTVAAPAKTIAPPPTISLELVKPGAKQVAVAGDFNDWKPERTPLVQIGNGRWVGDLNVKPGRHEYLFVVDGQWLPDPNAKENVQNPFGGKNSVLIVSA